jgi:hypothetical protein
LGLQSHIDDLGIRALVRNNRRAKNRVASNGPDMFGHYGLGKRVAVPYLDDKGKQRWTENLVASCLLKTLMKFERAETNVHRSSRKTSGITTKSLCELRHIEG